MENTILDQEFGNTEQGISYEFASSGKRFANCIIDIIGFYACVFVVAIFFFTFFPNTLNTPGNDGGLLGDVLFIFLWVLYYTLMEGIFRGKTLGKLITRTRAVTEDGGPIGYRKAFLRSLCRIIPFEPLSFLGSNIGWHDTYSGTRVVDETRPMDSPPPISAS